MSRESCPEGPVFTADRSGTKIPPGRPSGQLSRDMPTERNVQGHFENVARAGARCAVQVGEEEREAACAARGSRQCGAARALRSCWRARRCLVSGPRGPCASLTDQREALCVSACCPRPLAAPRRQPSRSRRPRLACAARRRRGTVSMRGVRACARLWRRARSSRVAAPRAADGAVPARACADRWQGLGIADRCRWRPAASSGAPCARPPVPAH